MVCFRMKFFMGAHTFFGTTLLNKVFDGTTLLNNYRFLSNIYSRNTASLTINKTNPRKSMTQLEFFQPMMVQKSRGCCHLLAHQVSYQCQGCHRKTGCRFPYSLSIKYLRFVALHHIQFKLKKTCVIMTSSVYEFPFVWTTIRLLRVKERKLLFGELHR